MIDQLKALLDAQQMRLSQLRQAGRRSITAACLANQVGELCRSLEDAITTATYLESQAKDEALIHAQFATGDGLGLSAEQQAWAASHDWYIRDVTMGAVRGVLVLDRSSQGDNELTFTNFQDLRAWAGY